MFTELCFIEVIPVQLLTLGLTFLLEQVGFHFWREEVAADCAVKEGYCWLMGGHGPTKRLSILAWVISIILERTLRGSLRSLILFAFLTSLCVHRLHLIYIFSIDELDGVSCGLIVLPECRSLLLADSFLLNLILAAIYEIIECILYEKLEGSAWTQGFGAVNKHLMGFLRSFTQET